MREYLRQKQMEAERKADQRRHVWEVIGTVATILLIYAEVALAIL